MNKTYLKGQKIKFLSPHNQKLDGEVYDSNEFAIVVVNPILGQFVIDHKDVIQDIGSIRSDYEDCDFEYYTLYRGCTPQNQTSNSLAPGAVAGAFGSSSPFYSDIDDDGC